MFDDKLHILSMTQYQNNNVMTLPSNVVCVFPVMSLFVCLSAVQHCYVGQEVHNLIRNQNKNVTTAIVATVTISTTNRVKNVLIMRLILFYFNLKVEVRNLYILYTSTILDCHLVIVILAWWDSI